MGSKPRVCYFQRKRRPNRNFSLEQIFDDIRARLSGQFDASVWSAPCLSSGVMKRLWIAVAAVFGQQEVNHVTGDINFACLFLRRSRTVLTILDCGILERKSGLARFIIWLFWFQLPVLRCRYVTVISESTRQTLLSAVWCDEGRVRVIPVAISPSFVSDPRSFDSQRPALLQVGTAPNKNVIRLARALEGLPCTLRIVGPLTGDQERELKVRQIDYHQAEGVSHDELLAFYRECDMLVFVSTHEGFGMPILEANATGRPVITSRVTSMPEVAGDAACLVDPFDVGSIRSGIEKVISDRSYRELLVENGYKNIQRFQAAGIAEKYAALYQEVLGARV